MLKKIKQFITVAAIGLASLAPAMVPVAVHAADPNIQDSVKSGTCLEAPPAGQTSSPTCDPADSTDSVNSLVADIINIFSWVVGVVSVIMIIVGGFQYITSGGDSNKVGTAKNTILYAIIGLIIVALAQFIVQFVLTRVTEP